MRKEYLSSVENQTHIPPTFSHNTHYIHLLAFQYISSNENMYAEIFIFKSNFVKELCMNISCESYTLLHQGNGSLMNFYT